MSWDQYYQKHKGRKPKGLYVRAIELAEHSFSVDSERLAVDLGSGAGIEANDMLHRSWRVLAIDREPAAIEALKEIVSPKFTNNLEVWCKSFEEIRFIPPCEFLYAYHTLPFCQANDIDRLWKLISDAIQPKGIFTGSFFGMNDEWVQSGKTIGTSKEKLENYLQGFEIIHYHEIDEIGPTALDGPKHWHIIEIIARKI